MANFFLLLGLNVFAAYLPAIFWVPALPATGDKAFVFLLSPMSYLLLAFQPRTHGAALGYLYLFAFFQLAVAGIWSQSSVARVILPLAWFFVCLVQGLLVSKLIWGLAFLGQT